MVRSAGRVRTAKRGLGAVVTPPVGGGGGGGNVSTGIPLLGRSGLPWNASYFGTDTSITGANRFETWLGRNLDASMYFTGRTDWSTNHLMNFQTSYAAWPGYRIICVPPQPEFAGASGLLGGTASGGNNQNWLNWANTMLTKWPDDGRTIVRLGWEFNGDWYKWGIGNASNYPSASDAMTLYVNAFTNVARAIRSVAPNTKFDACVNEGNTRSGITWYGNSGAIFDRLLANGVLDMAGIDWYAWYPAPTSQSLFDAKAGNKNPSPNGLYNWCVTNNVAFSIDEQGNVTGDSSVGVGSGDDPAFWERVWVWLQNRAVGNGGKLALHTTYNENGLPLSLRHGLYNTNDGSSQNPNAAARYRQIWRNASL